MTILLSFYFVFLVIVLIYMAINIFHIIYFRLGLPGDRSQVAVAVYVMLVAAILAITAIAGIAASSRV